MKILFVITGLGVGGAERQVVDLSERLAKRGHEVKIAFLTGAAQLVPDASHVQTLSLGVKNKSLGFFVGVYELMKLIKSFNPDVVHSHMVHANLISRLTRVFRGFPVLICTAHSSNEGGLLRMFAYRLTDRYADLSTNVGIDAVKTFEKKKAVRPGRMISVVNGIDVGLFFSDDKKRAMLRNSLGIEEHIKIVLAVGRFCEAKDYPNLLKAFVNVAEVSQHARLWVAGEGPLLLDMQAFARALGIDSKVNFLGVRSDIPDLLRVADLYVLSSAWEGLPLAIGEAMASSKVIVATDCGGVREFLGEDGLIVPPRQPKRLAEGMLEALALSTSEARTLGNRARARINDLYSLDAVVDKWLEIYADPKKALN